jgi:hypothetical protein
MVATAVLLLLQVPPPAHWLSVMQEPVHTEAGAIAQGDVLTFSTVVT